jgi:FkbM family methyltransferase
MRPAGSLLRNIHRTGEIVRCATETSRWGTLTLAYLGMKDLEYPFSLELKGLQPIALKEVSDVWTFWQIFARRVYPLSGWEKVIVDAGANVGFFSLYAARTCPLARILAIEPSSSTYQRLVENVKKSGFGDRVCCLQACLAGSDGQRYLELTNRRSQLQRLLPHDSMPDSGLRVNSVTLNSALQNEVAIDLLKMDIEGSEYEVLHGCSSETLAKIRKVILEFHPDEGSPPELLKFMQRNGFSLESKVENAQGYGLATLVYCTPRLVNPV